jgi:hypothetical protein
VEDWSTSGRHRLKDSMSNNIDFICTASASNFSSAVAMRKVRVGGLGLGANGWIGGGLVEGKVVVEVVEVRSSDQPWRLRIRSAGCGLNRCRGLTTGFYGSRRSIGKGWLWYQMWRPRPDTESWPACTHGDERGGAASSRKHP